MQTLRIIRPDDMHLHLRDGFKMRSVLADSAKQMARAIIMPNLKPPVTTVAMAEHYRQTILAARPNGSIFEPLMTIYLTDNTSIDEISKIKQSGVVHAVKLYPSGATTNSDAGVTDIYKVMPVLEKMAELSVPLLVHGEVTDSKVDIFDREEVFIERCLNPLHQRLPNLKIVFEHITTSQAAEYVSLAPDNIMATVTPQHLLLNRNAIFVGGINPHNYCLPILKRETHRQALLNAVSGQYSHKFMLGTDSAPHERECKENACGCAGVYSANAALELYAEAFDSIDSLDKLEKFASINGADFYGLPLNQDYITLNKDSWRMTDFLPYDNGILIPLRAGSKMAWRIID